jgi:Sulfotransferase family
MATPDPQPPVLLIGMHRSGTTLVAQLLRRLGFFLGERRQQHDEALFFRGLNDLFLRQSGAAWDYPAPVELLLRDKPVRALALEHTRAQLSSPQAIGFLGPARYLRLRSIDRLATPWGWKDPRNTFTLPLWLQLFPDARVIHVLRHGVDVAASLVERRARAVSDARALYRRRRRLYGIRGKRKQFVGTVRCATLEGSFSLWEEYVDEGSRHAEALGPRALEVRFEDLVARPTDVLSEVAAFAGLTPTPSELGEAVAAVRPERAYAFRGRPDLLAFAASVEERLGRRGYSAAVLEPHA